MKDEESELMNPRLREVQPSLIEHQGAPFIMLKDPLGISPGVLLVPQPLAPLLGLCDGTRDLNGLKEALAFHTGIRLSLENVEHVITQLDSALMLDNEKYARARKLSLDDFRSASCREAALSGGGYPDNPEELRLYLETFFSSASGNDVQSDNVRGIICPHIDFHRGGDVYAEVWRRTNDAVINSELVIVLGTNHMGGGNQFALTRQNYASPFGTLPTAGSIVDRLAREIGHYSAFEEELYHRNEHSIELALVWLHYLLGEKETEVLPILCGSFDKFIHGEDDPADNHEISTVVAMLREITSERNTLVVAAADMSHVGPAFGDRQPVDETGRELIQEADADLIDDICHADADAFFSRLKRDKDARRVCGLSPIYMTLRMLEGARGEVCAYEQCPADETNSSLVSICGVILE